MTNTYVELLTYILPCEFYLEFTKMKVMLIIIIIIKTLLMRNN